MRHHCYSLIALSLFMLSPAAYAQPALQVHDGYAYAPLGSGAVSAGYFTLENKGTQPLTLTGAQSSAFASIELHDHVHENGMMKMRRIDSITVPAGERVTLKSGGLHLMLFEPAQELKEGMEIPLTLTLQSGETLSTTLQLRARSKSAGSGASGAHHAH